MSNSDTPIPLPNEWSDLSAGGTRFECMWNLYEISNWNCPTSPELIKKSVSSYATFFLDDFMFKDNPVSIIGQSLYI